jgi:hypothetical protein
VGTNSLNASSLNTTTNNKSNSIGLNAGGNGNANTNSAKLNRVSLDYTNNKHNSKTKVLATLGSGNIQIADITPALSPIELDLLLVVVLRLLAFRLLVVRLSCPLSLPSLSPVSVAAIKLPVPTQPNSTVSALITPTTNTILKPKS